MAERPKDTPELRSMLRTYTREQVEKYNNEHGTKIHPSLVEALFDHESKGYDPYATSHTGAAGIAQFTKDTAAEYGLSADDRYNPLKAIPAGIAHFAKGLEAFPNSMVDGIRAYNGGIKGTNDYLAGTLKATPERIDEIKNFPTNVLRSARKLGMVEREKVPAPAATPALTAEPQQVSAEESSATPESAALGAVPEVARSVGGFLYDQAKQVGHMVTQFPRELHNATQVQGANEQMRNAGLPGPPAPIPPIDPLGAINFATFPLGMGSGRIANAGINAGLSVFNVADQMAQTKARDAGLNWNDLPTGERVSRLLSEVNTDNIIEHIPSIAASAGLGLVFGGKPRDKSVVQALKDVKTSPPTIEQQTIIAANKAGEEAYARKVLETTAANAEIRAGNALAIDDFAGKVAPLESRITAAELRTGLPRTEKALEKLTKADVVEQMTGLVKQEFKLPPANPAKPIYEAVRATYGARPVPINKARIVDQALEVAGKDAVRTDTLGAHISKLTRSLSDPNNVAPDIRTLLKEAEVTTNSKRRIQILTEVEKLKQQLRPPTVNDVLDRAEAIDALRRSKAFLTASESEKELVGKMTRDLSRAMRKEGGFVEQLIPTKAAAEWQRANALYKDYSQRERVISTVTKAFGETKIGGASTIRNKLVANEKKARAAFGDENYASLLDLARDLDTLNLALPKAAKLTMELEAPTPFKPAKVNLSNRVNTPGMLTTLHLTRALFKYGGPAVGLEAAMAGAHGAGVAAALGSPALAFLITTPAARKAFSGMVKAAQAGGVTANHVTSTKFMKAYGRLLAAKMVHDSYGEQIAPPQPPIREEEPIMEPTPRGPEDLIDLPVAPAIASGRRLGRVPGQ